MTLSGVLFTSYVLKLLASVTFPLPVLSIIPNFWSQNLWNWLFTFLVTIRINHLSSLISLTSYCTRRPLPVTGLTLMTSWTRTLSSSTDHMVVDLLPPTVVCYAHTSSSIVVTILSNIPWLGLVPSMALWVMLALLSSVPQRPRWYTCLLRTHPLSFPSQYVGLLASLSSLM